MSLNLYLSSVDSLLLFFSFEAKSLVAKDGDLFEEFVCSIKRAANFQCSSVNSDLLFLREECEEFYVSHLPSSIPKVQKDELLSSESAEFLFSISFSQLVSDFHEDTSLATHLALQKVVNASQAPLIPHSYAAPVSSLSTSRGQFSFKRHRPSPSKPRKKASFASKASSFSASKGKQGFWA